MANRNEIIAEIEALEAHCRAPLMTMDGRARWLQDWCADLASFPVDKIREVVRQYRQSGTTKFPTPGTLLPMLRAKMPLENAGEKPLPWAPISNEEYDRLTIREKIRHQKILAHEAGCKAGPMWRNPTGGAKISRPTPGHTPADDLSPAFRHWKAVQAEHLAEAKRLQEIIHKQIAAA